MDTVTISIEEHDRLRKVERNFKKAVAEIEKCADAKAREEFVSKAVELAGENGRLNGRVAELEKERVVAIRRAADAIDERRHAEKAAKDLGAELDDAKNRIDQLRNSNDRLFTKSCELQDKLYRLRNRGLFARIFRRYE